MLNKLTNFIDKQFVTGLLVGVLMAGLGAFAFAKHQEAQFQEQVVEANEQAREWQLTWNETHQAYEDRALQVFSQRALLKTVQSENEQLANALEEAENRLLSVQRTKTRLEAQLDSSRTEVSQTDTAEYTVALDESVYLNEGGFLNVKGTVTVITTGPTAETDLGVTGEFPLTVVLSRNDEGEIVVDAFTGDSRLSVKQVDVKRVAKDDPTSGASRALSEALGQQLTGVGPWLNRGAGYLACSLLK